MAVKSSVANRKGVAEFFETTAMQEAMKAIMDKAKTEAGEKVDGPPEKNEDSDDEMAEVDETPEAMP
eukprot:11131090-Lingulodinium_polyedra.AAC.1